MGELARASDGYKHNQVLADFTRKLGTEAGQEAYEDWELNLLGVEYDHYRAFGTLSDALCYEGNESNHDALLDSIRGGNIKAAQEALEKVLDHAAKKHAEEKLEEALRKIENDRIDAEWESRRYDEKIWH